MRLAKRVAIVTETSPNIGGGIAEGLGEEGAIVACVDVAPDNARQCADAITRRGGLALGIACDVTDEREVEAMVARLMVEQKRRGSIVVVVSTAGHQGQAGNIAYSTSKSGLLNFPRAAAMDLARHGIRVNSLTPTATDPEEAADRAVAWGRPRPEPRARGLDFPKMVPMGKLPSPRHYARAVAFLTSDDAEMITGTDLRVDAGAIAKYWPWIPNA